MYKLATATIIALAIGSSACVTNPYEWIDDPVPEPQESPIEAAIRTSRVASSFSAIEFEENNPGSYICLGEELSILLVDDSIWVGTNVGNPIKIGSTKEGYDWEALTEVLQVHRGLALFSSPPIIRRIQLAAADDVQYGEILRAMDSAIAVDFTKISYVRPKYQYADFTGLTRIPSDPSAIQ